MTHVSGEVVIDRGVEDVFDFVADERSRYDPRVRSAELLSDGPIGVGSRFRIETVSMGRPAEMLVEVTEYERPRRLASTTRTAGMEIYSGLRFEPVDVSTRLRWSSELRPHGVLRLLSPILGVIGRRQSTTIWGGPKHTLDARRMHRDRARGQHGDRQRAGPPLGAGWRRAVARGGGCPRRARHDHRPA